jgi:hypothetical protein
VKLFYGAMSLFRRRGGKATAQLHGYRLGPGRNQITLLFEQGDGDRPAEVEVLDEDAGHVRVRVRYKHYNGMRLLFAIPREIVASLTAPLGDRTVLDGDGSEVPPA